MSSSEANPLEKARQLFQSQAPPAPLDRPYVDANVLRYYVLLHDIQTGRGDEYERARIACTVLKVRVLISVGRLALGGRGTTRRADQLFSRLKATFGMHSHLLRINSSASPSAPGFFPAGLMSRAVPTPPCHLTAYDLDGVASLVREFVTQSLLPHMARTVAQLNETWAASRRGITGRLFSAGKKYFGGSSATPTPSASPTPSSVSTATLGAPAAGRPGAPGAVGSLYPQPALSSSSSSIASTTSTVSSAPPATLAITYAGPLRPAMRTSCGRPVLSAV